MLLITKYRFDKETFMQIRCQIKQYLKFSAAKLVWNIRFVPTIYGGMRLSFLIGRVLAFINYDGFVKSTNPSGVKGCVKC